MSCEGCQLSVKGQSRSLDTIKAEAKKYAIEHQKTVAIYKEANEYLFIEAGEATRLNLPIMEYISKHC